jgi:hypothetical protein
MDVDPVTIFETFDQDPSEDWINYAFGINTFDYNTGGWLDASIARDRDNRALFVLPLGLNYDKTVDFWWEMDLQMISSVDNISQCLFGVFNTDENDNHHNVIADRFFYVSHSSGPRGNRHDIWGYDSNGNFLKKSSTPYDPGIPFGQSVRVKGKYYYDPISDIGYARLNVYEIVLGGGIGNLIMGTGIVPVIESGQTLFFNAFGLGNRTDGNLRNVNVIKVDNLYFSTEGENSNPIEPSFGVT